LWDTTEKVFLHCGTQRKWFFSVVGYNREQSLDGYQIFSVVSHNAGIFLPLYPISQQKLMRSSVFHVTEAFSALYPTSENNLFFVINTTQKNCKMQCRIIFCIVSLNVTSFFPLWDTTEDVLSRCGIQQKRFSSIVGYNGRGFFFFVGYNGRGFFPLWDTMEKNDTTKNDLKFLMPLTAFK
jgi:hypothetical protein